LQPSTVVDDDDGHARPHPERTSTGLMLSRAETARVARIEARLARITAWPVENGEGLQILRYAKGQEYRAHFDAFPGGAAGQVHCASGGQRVCTVLVTLRSPERGGGTSFPNIGLALRPRAGSAILFHNVDQAGRRARDTLHAGQPVEQGDKVILSYWQREREFGHQPSG
jgi:prolyl 4-hydroxylase